MILLTTEQIQRELKEKVCPIVDAKIVRICEVIAKAQLKKADKQVVKYFEVEPLMILEDWQDLLNEAE